MREKALLCLEYIQSLFSMRTHDIICIISCEHKHRTEEVLDNEAICFTSTFYDCLFNKGFTVQDAFYEAKQEVEIEVDGADKNKFLLLPFDQEKNSSHYSSSFHNKFIEGIPPLQQQQLTLSPHALTSRHTVSSDDDYSLSSVVSSTTSTMLMDGSPILPKINCHIHHTRKLIGRNLVVAEVYDAIHNHDDNRVVLITGEAKIGKTEVS